jgi:predicted ATPase
MITQLRLKLGSLPGRPPIVIDAPSVTVFVGPNNGGKSQALREIFAFCRGDLNGGSAILDKLVFAGRDASIVRTELEAAKRPINLGDRVSPGNSIFVMGGEEVHVPDETFVRSLVSPNEHLSNFAQWYLRFQTVNLDGPSRVGLINPQARGDLKRPQSPLARLLTDDPKRIALRRTIYEAIRLHFAIDAQAGDRLTVRLGQVEPPDERSFNDAALDYMRTARPIDVMSDGVKAFTGILVQVRAGNPKIIIVDEPEAFLHPSLAFKLGKELATGAAAEGKHVFAATHSPQFVMGTILSGAKVNIIRLTYNQDVGTARLLPSTELTQLMQDPLLRSVGVLSALFYDHVIVCEADADRAFYQELNERLLAAGDMRGIPHALFLNADNKHTIPRITSPLRKLGIPAAAIADIDVIKEGGEQWTRHLRACVIPTEEHQPYGTRRARVLEAVNAKSGKFKTEGGVALLSGSEREAADNLFDDLGRYGFFIVRRGEVESWLSDLEVPRSKESWLRSIFERMGDDPNAPEYVRPGSGDVWDFLGQLHSWFINPYRRGIPD